MSFTANRPTNWGLLVAAALGLMVAMWYMSSALSDVQNYNDWDKAKQMATMYKAAALFLFSFLLGCGVNVKALLGPLGQFVPGTTTVTETKISETKVVNEPPVNPPPPPENTGG